MNCHFLRDAGMPDGQISPRTENLSSPLCKNISLPIFPQISGITPAVSFRSRGVGRRHERWDEMRWTQRRRARTRSQGGSSVSDHRAPDERR
jgi:hypothetical protein